MSPSTPNSRIAAAAHHDANGDLGAPHSSNPLKRARASPSLLDTPNASASSSNADDKSSRDDRRQALLRDLYSRSERMINRFFHTTFSSPLSPSPPQSPHGGHAKSSSQAQQAPSSSSRPDKSKRTINEDDYGDDEDDEEDELQADPPTLLNSQIKSSNHLLTSSASSKPPLSSSLKPPLENGESTGQTQDGESSEDVRKRLEGEKKAAEDAAIDSFQTMFYTLENDRDAMVDQQKLDELDRQVENEMSGPNAAAPGPEAQGTLSTTNLGASSLTLKHLFAQIDANRNKVKASDTKIRTLIGEVRKNRSKWASEDRVGQEELYEAAERVLMELKSMTEYAAPFLTKVKRADAPDYHRIITDPMDLGTMLKKLNKAQYDSKKEFCDDLNLIWQNCLDYNTKSDHPFRRKAIHMQKETGRLVPLIPDIVIRDRKDIEREEQQLEQLDEANGSESDEDDRPIAATRGRKAPSKSSKGTAPSRKGLPGAEGGQDEFDSKPKPTSNVLTTLRDQLKPDVDSAEGSQHGLSTPPPGMSTPVGANGYAGSAAPASHADPNDLETLNTSTVGGALPAEEPDEEDDEYRIWKRVTKKDRARAASERHRLFLHDKLNPEEPALLRSKRGMRRWAKQQIASSGRRSSKAEVGSAEEEIEDESAQGPLAEDISRDEDTTLPDYYEALAGMPEINSRLQWEVDYEGLAVDHRDDCLRLVPPGLFLSPASELTAKLDKNMRQMQDTRKVAAKIGIVKQMQIQTQTYQNQFQKYAPEPFHEADIEPLVVTDDGPFMNPTTSRTALQRSVGKIFYSAGFEDFQPSAMEAITDLASDYFSKVVRTLKLYTESRKTATVVQASDGTAQTVYTPQFSPEAAVLHTLLQNGLELNEIESYIHETCNTLPGKLELHHSRMRDHYAELVRPALDPASVGTDGAGAFADGNETQFVAGDFAEDIDEDFFGFKELGLDREFGLASLSVPLHLLQSRMANLYQPTDPSAANASGNIMDTPPAYSPVTSDSVEGEIGLVQEFFRERLEKTEDGHGPLIEDEELPAKQRFPKPRLPPNGKISSPRKRPLREQQMLARKRKRAEIEAERQRERELEEGTSAPNTAVEAAGRISDSEPLAKMPRLTNGAAFVEAINGASSNANSGTDHTSALTNGAAADRLKLRPTVEGDATSTDPEKKSKASANGNHDDQEDAEGDPDDRNGMLSPSLPIAAH